LSGGYEAGTKLAKSYNQNECTKIIFLDTSKEKSEKSEKKSIVGTPYLKKTCLGGPKEKN
jgi:hypothetical protein